MEYDNFAFVYVIGREEKLFVILVGENSPPELCKKELFFLQIYVKWTLYLVNTFKSFSFRYPL